MIDTTSKSKPAAIDHIAIPVTDVEASVKWAVALLYQGRLKEAEKLYPAPWIEEAFREAVSLNKRNWRYIARILERWSLEGKGSGESGRDSKKERGPSRYLRGRYGHLVRH